MLHSHVHRCGSNRRFSPTTVAVPTVAPIADAGTIVGTISPILPCSEGYTAYVIRARCAVEKHNLIPI